MPRSAVPPVLVAELGGGHHEEAAGVCPGGHQGGAVRLRALKARRSSVGTRRHAVPAGQSLVPGGRGTQPGRPRAQSVGDRRSGRRAHQDDCGERPDRSRDQFGDESLRQGPDIVVLTRQGYRPRQQREVDEHPVASMAAEGDGQGVGMRCLHAPVSRTRQVLRFHPPLLAREVRGPWRGRGGIGTGEQQRQPPTRVDDRVHLGQRACAVRPPLGHGPQSQGDRLEFLAVGARSRGADLSGQGVASAQDPRGGGPEQHHDEHHGRDNGRAHAATFVTRSCQNWSPALRRRRPRRSAVASPGARWHPGEMPPPIGRQQWETSKRVSHAIVVLSPLPVEGATANLAGPYRENGPAARARFPSVGGRRAPGAEVRSSRVAASPS